jgi:hypothetical protein
MKRKFVQALLPFFKDTVNSIKGDANFRNMTTHDILQEIVARKIFEKNADDALARARGVRAPNLALKCNAPTFGSRWNICVECYSLDQ